MRVPLVNSYEGKIGFQCSSVSSNITRGVLFVLFVYKLKEKKQFMCDPPRLFLTTFPDSEFCPAAHRRVFISLFDGGLVYPDFTVISMSGGFEVREDNSGKCLLTLQLIFDVPRPQDCVHSLV